MSEVCVNPKLANVKVRHKSDSCLNMVELIILTPTSLSSSLCRRKTCTHRLYNIIKEPSECCLKYKVGLNNIIGHNTKKRERDIK